MSGPESDWAGPDIPTIMSTDDLAAAAAAAAGVASLTTTDCQHTELCL